MGRSILDAILSNKRQRALTSSAGISWSFGSQSQCSNSICNNIMQQSKHKCPFTAQYLFCYSCSKPLRALSLSCTSWHWETTAACLLTSSTTTTSTTGCSPHCVLDVFTGLLFVRILLRSSEYMIACGIRSYEIEKLVLQIEKLRLPWNATHHGFHVIWD